VPLARFTMNYPSPTVSGNVIEMQNQPLPILTRD
jgi:hypothetical protein